MKKPMPKKDRDDVKDKGKVKMAAMAPGMKKGKGGVMLGSAAYHGRGK